MEKISSLLKAPKKPITTANSERAELIGYFADEVDKEREGTEYGKVSYARIAAKLAHLPVFDLYAFKSQLEDYRARGNSFSKGFFGALKVRSTEYGQQ